MSREWRGLKWNEFFLIFCYVLCKDFDYIDMASVMASTAITHGVGEGFWVWRMKCSHYVWERNGTLSDLMRKKMHYREKKKWIVAALDISCRLSYERQQQHINGSELGWSVRKKAIKSLLSCPLSSSSDECERASKGPQRSFSGLVSHWSRGNKSRSRAWRDRERQWEKFYVEEKLYHNKI